MSGPDTSTLEDALEVDERRLRRGVTWRRLTTLLFALLVLAAVTGWFGVRSRTMTRSVGGTTATLQFASITRRGVSTPWRLLVTRPDGFTTDVVVRVSASYLDVLNVQSITPQPDSETTTGDMVQWTFSKPPTNQFTVVLGAEANPSASAGRHRGNAVITVGSQPPVTLSFTTWMMP